MTDADAHVITVAADKLATLLKSAHNRLKSGERVMKRLQYERKEAFYRNVSDTVKRLGYSLLGGDDLNAAAHGPPEIELRFDAFVDKAEKALIAVVNDCLLVINSLEDNVKAVRGDGLQAVATLADELTKAGDDAADAADDGDDGEYEEGFDDGSSVSSVATSSKSCRVSTVKKVVKTLQGKMAASRDLMDRAKRPARKTRSVSSLSSGRTYVIGSKKTTTTVQDERVDQRGVQRRYLLKEREAMFEERRSRPVVTLPKVTAKGSWGQTWHQKLVERKRLSLVDIRCRNKYAEKRMGDSFQVFKEVKAIWRTNLLGLAAREKEADDGDEVEVPVVRPTPTPTPTPTRQDGLGRRAEMASAGRRPTVGRKVASKEEAEMITRRFDDAPEVLPKWVKRGHNA